MVNSQILYDLSFDYKWDNPFQGDIDRKKITTLRRTIANNASQFCECDYLEDSFYAAIRDLSTLFNKPLEDGNRITDNPLIVHIKDFIENIEGVSPQLKKWSQTNKNKLLLTPPPPTPITINEEDTEAELENLENGLNSNFTGSNDYGFIGGSGIVASTLGGLYNYDISGDICINYEDLKALCLNIARYKLAPDNKKDEMVKTLENEKRRKLIVEIDRYRKVKEIAVENDFNILDFTNDQLEHCLEKCKTDFERYKLQDLSLKGCKIGEALYDKIFPEGIPISKTKKIRFGGIGKEIIKQVFDGRTPAGVSWANILRSRNIHVSDGMLIGATLLQTLITKIEIYEDKPKDDKEDKNEDDKPAYSSAYSTGESESEDED
jgi:hypothetical protein